MIDIERACCFTGYRPEKFDFDFSPTEPKYRDFMSRLVTAISKMIEDGCDTFYTGMAMGYDIVAGEHVATIKLLNKRIKLIAIVPFKGQENGFSEAWKSRYYKLLSECDEVLVLNEQYSRNAFWQRNKYMVDRSRYCLTFFDGKPGGTNNTVKYAVKNGRVLYNIFDTDPLYELKRQFSKKIVIYPPEQR